MTEQTRPTATEPTDEQLRSWGYDGPNGRAQYKRDEATQGAASSADAYVQGHRDRYQRDRQLDVLCLNCGRPWAVKDADAPPTVIEAVNRIVNMGPSGDTTDMLAIAEDAIRGLARAAEAAEGAVPRAEGLDVERLTMALHEVGVGCPVDEHWRPDRHEPEWHEPQAIAVAAEYARLSRPSDERDTEIEASHE